MTQTATATIHDGYYTVIVPFGHRTFRIRTQDQDAAFAAGKQIISFLSGSDNTSDYTSFAFIIDGQLLPWKRFRDGHEVILGGAKLLLHSAKEAGLLYAQQSGNCYICNRMLTTPESVAAGIGPTCASRM